jgi:KDO2-lipid IV(A) lauroyltransferase|tara:strand:+ start:1808 stop:2671 length:864 start_codon:yes stop_codon:yes gene_type:complete
MNKLLLKLLIFLVSLIPLFFIQLIGVLIGHLFNFLNLRSRDILVDNLTNSNVYSNKSDLKRAINTNIGETGKTILEAFAIWTSKEKRILGWIKEVKGLDAIEKAQKNKKGIIFLTPHLGCYEITSIYYGSKFPLTVLYRPPRQKWLINLIKKGRQKGFQTLAPTDKSGVKQILGALKKNEAIGILPDQAANKGEGEWVDFFGRPAYTMVLVSKLVKKTGANVIMTFGERLGNGKGFKIHFETIDPDAVSTPSKLNKLLEREIRKAPTQYLWNYDKHKGYEAQIKKTT